MSTHTPGPWSTVELNGGRIAIVAHDATDVATLTHTSRADAALIAAAPELLAALERSAALLGRYPKHDDAWAQARAAIAKATQEN